MRQRKLKSALAATLLLLSIVFSVLLVGCTAPIPSDYATSFLDDYDLPAFSTNKLLTIERIYRDYYVKDLPAPEEMARLTAELYFENFHEKIDTGDKKEVTEALVSCYVYATGDPYSVYRTASEYEDYAEDLSGEFYGIGVVVTYERVTHTITVNEVYEDSGADKAGIRAGDLLVAVNGTRLEDSEYNYFINLIKGEDKTAVDITVQRDGKEITLTATRGKVVDKSVSYSIDESKIGYIKISSFKSNTFAQFKDAVDALKLAGAVGIIYDLRSNTGGYLSAVVNMLSYIASDNSVIVSFSDGYAKPQTDRHSHSLSLPSVILCNEYTASAAELFTSAMRDFDDMYGQFEVTLVGATTYGKGVMQSTVEIGDGSTLTLTVAYYNPPSGGNYDGIGIEPDVKVPLGTEGDAQLDTAYTEINKLLNNNN